MDLKGKVALVTGGAVRVGREITLNLVEAGCHVFCHYNRSKTEAQGLKEKYPDLNLLQGNLNHVDKISSLVSQVLKTTGKFDILINSAAIFPKSPLGEVTEKDWDMVFDINLKSYFFLAQEVSRKMLEQASGKIINIGDISGLRPWPSYLPYSITKSGVISLTKGLAKALAPNIQVNCINPGPVMIPNDYTESQVKQAIEKTLLKRAGTGKDIANAVRFILEDGDYLTGMVLSVDGGRSIK